MPEGDVKLNLRYFIRSAIQKKMPWSTLTFFLNDLTPTLERSREVVEILVKELEMLAIKLEKSGLEVEEEPIKEETFDENQVESEHVDQKISLYSDFDNSDSEFADQDVESEEEFEGEKHATSNQEEKFFENAPFDDNEQKMKKELYTFIETDNESEDVGSERENEFDSLETASIDLPPKGKRSKTNICKIYLKKPKDLGIEITDTEEGPSKCKFCGKIFKLSSNLEDHEKIHEELLQNFSLNCNDNKEKVFEDSFVEVNVNEIVKELNTIPKTEYESKDYQDEIDSNESENKQTKRSYIRGQSKTCETCFKTFNSSWSMKNHRKIHTGEKPYKCKYCWKRFSILQYLKGHERIHTGIRPYECKTCHKSFKQLGNLQSHEKIHSGVKPYQCKTCKRCFTRSDAYNSHMKRKKSCLSL